MESSENQTVVNSKKGVAKIFSKFEWKCQFFQKNPLQDSTDIFVSEI